MFIGWVIFHVIVCLALVVVVLMQSAKGEGLAGGTAFGGGMSSAVFGGRGAASFLSKATTALAILFMVNCGGLALISQRASTPAQAGAVSSSSAVTRQVPQQPAQNQTVQPGDTSSNIELLPGEAVDEGGTDNSTDDTGSN